MAVTKYTLTGVPRLAQSCNTEGSNVRLREGRPGRWTRDVQFRPGGLSQPMPALQPLRHSGMQGQVPCRQPRFLASPPVVSFSFLSFIATHFLLLLLLLHFFFLTKLLHLFVLSY